MKKEFLLLTLVCLGSQTAQAALSRSAISSMTINVYGIYMTADPLCLTGWVATMPAQTTPTLVDFVSLPTLGTGIVPTSIGCVALILQNSITATWAAGSYSGSDNVCDAGGTVNPMICQDALNATVGQPPELIAKVNANGVQVATGCDPTANRNQLIFAFLSTTAGCYGNVTADTAAGNAGDCVSGGASTNNTFDYPRTEGDVARGIRLDSPTSSSAYKMIIDPDRMIGNNSGSCNIFTAPRFNFASTN